MNKQIAFLTALLLSTSTLGFGAACDSDTLADYITDGGREGKKSENDTLC